MSRDYYLRLAEAGARFPIGTDLVLHEKPDAQEILVDGARLGQVMAEAAARYQTPLAIPLMDLRLEKEDLVRAFDVPEEAADTFHFDEPPPAGPAARYAASSGAPFSPRGRAHVESVRYIREHTSLVPVGMAIGPFSLMTKLLADPIAAVALAARGQEDEPEARPAAACLELAEAAVHRSVAAQIAAGASAMLICEPAANSVYISPRYFSTGILDRFVLGPMSRLKARLDAAGVDLIFHDCGQLTTEMVRQFAERLSPAVLSLGSGRRLWEDAAVVPRNVVLYGNLPTKNFYSDAAVTPADVERMTAELVEKMRAAGHPFILGSECDVLHVPDAAETIRRKVSIMMAR